MQWFKKKQQPVVPTEGHGDALVAIAEEDLRALGLVGDVMERNAAESARVMGDALEMEQRAHKQTIAELRDARRDLQRVQDHIEWILGGQMPDEIASSIEAIAEEMAEQVVERERTVL